jgi:hypothetical protein
MHRQEPWGDLFLKKKKELVIIAIILLFFANAVFGQRTPAVAGARGVHFVPFQCRYRVSSDLRGV